MSSNDVCTFSEHGVLIRPVAGGVYNLDGLNRGALSAECCFRMVTEELLGLYNSVSERVVCVCDECHIVARVYSLWRAAEYAVFLASVYSEPLIHAYTFHDALWIEVIPAGCPREILSALDELRSCGEVA